MGWLRRALGAVAVVGLVLAGGPGADARPPWPAHADADLGALPASAETRDLVAWILATADHRGRAFALVDKKSARLYVFTPHGRLAGSSAVLLGVAVGDRSTPGVGELAPARIPIEDRTTPAGRFATEPGINLDGDAVIWFDYDAGLAIHRLRPDAAERARSRRLAAEDPQAHRVSAGCVVAPVAFYESVVMRWLGHTRGTLYVLPEVEPVGAVFSGMDGDL
jgi:hypothetical protein